MMHSNHPMPDVRVDQSVTLLLKAQAGDNDALNQLLARYLPRLKRWASGRLPWGLRTMLETGDLVQDAIVNALPHLDKLEIRSERALFVYLQRAVKNRVIDLHKRARRRPVREELPPDVPAGGVSPQEAAIGAEALESYKRALASLKDEERQAIMLRVEQGLDFEEVAIHLGKPSADAARMAVTRAIVRLADKMGRRRQRGPAGNGR
jgi:RNA polymerase sigma-70 factor, ECF subfamily